MKIKKTPAFTLTEMLIVLAISAIVAGLAFTIISLFTRNVHHIQQNYSVSTKVRLFQEQLSLDFNRFHSITYRNGLSQLELKTPLDSITYYFTENAIIRNTDTILKSNYKKEFFSFGIATKQGNVDAIKLTLEATNVPVFIFKQNDATSYLENNGN